MDDEEIRAALRRGDIEGAFDLVERAHGHAVYSICYRYLKSRSAAEDVMQQTLTIAYEQHHQLLGVAQIRGWLIQVARRRCIDAQRSSQRADRLHRAAGEDHSADTADDGNAFQQLASTEKRRALEACLDSLDPDTAALVVMRYHEAMSWAQIAQAVGLPLDTVRMRVNRGALQRLRECLESKGFAP